MTALSPLPVVGYDPYPAADPYPLPPEKWLRTGVSFPKCDQCMKERIDTLAALPDNWDGYGARPIAPAMLDAVRRFMARLSLVKGELMLVPGTERDCLLPAAVPMANGSVQLEWHVGDRILELEFETPELIRYLKWWPAQGVGDEDSYYAADLDHSARLIRWALSG